MGEAKRRGTYAQRKAEAEFKKAGQELQRKQEVKRKFSSEFKQWLAMAAITKIDYRN